MASVRNAVWVAGLMIVGTPANRAGANFSRAPQQGKLNALTWTATPFREVAMWVAMNEPSRARISGSPSRRTVELGSSLRPFEA